MINRYSILIKISIIKFYNILNLILFSFSTIDKKESRLNCFLSFGSGLPMDILSMNHNMSKAKQRPI